MLGRAYGLPLLIAVAITDAAGGCAYKAQARATGWSIAETQHVRLLTNAEPERAAQFAAELQRIRDTLAGRVLRCGFEDERDRFQVTVLADSEYGDIAPSSMGAFYRTWGITWLPEFEGRIVMPDELALETRQVYQHELTHHLVANCFPRAPIWLSEGMAQFLETVVVDEGHMLVGVPPFAIVKDRRPPDTAVYRGVRVLVLSRAELPPVAEVTAMKSEQFHLRNEHESLRMMGNYAASWALVHLLELDTSDLHGRFAAFLGGLRRFDADPDALLARHFAGVDLQARLDGYLQRGAMPYVRLRAEPPRVIAPRVRPLSAGEAHLHWAWLWAGARGKEGSRERLAEHLAAARQKADSRARAYLLSAATLVIAGDLAGAEREVDAGLRASPDDPGLLHAQVELLLGRKADPSAAAERLRAVARTAEQLCALARVELARGQPVKALSLAVRGFNAKPSSWSCRECIDLARKALGPGRPAAMLAPRDRVARD